MKRASNDVVADSANSTTKIAKCVSNENQTSLMLSIASNVITPPKVKPTAVENNNNDDNAIDVQKQLQTLEQQMQAMKNKYEAQIFFLTEQHKEEMQDFTEQNEEQIATFHRNKQTEIDTIRSTTDAEIFALQSELCALKQEHETLKQSKQKRNVVQIPACIDNSNSLHRKIGALEQSVKNLRSHITKQNTTIGTLTTTLQQNNDTIHNLSEQLNPKDKQIIQLSSLLDDKKKLVESLQTNVNSLELKLLSTTNTISENNKTIKLLQLDVTKQATELTTLKNNAAQQEERIQHLNELRAIDERTLQNATDTDVVNNERIFELSRDNDALNVEVARFQTTIQDLQAQIQILRNKNATNHVFLKNPNDPDSSSGDFQSPPSK